MRKIYQIDCSARKEGSTSRKLAQKLLKKIKKSINLPVVAIGGINEKNYKNLLLNKADFLAISSYVWNNKKLKPHEAIKSLT